MVVGGLLFFSLFGCLFADDALRLFDFLSPRDDILGPLFEDYLHFLVKLVLVRLLALGENRYAFFKKDVLSLVLGGVRLRGDLYLGWRELFG